VVADTHIHTHPDKWSFGLLTMTKFHSQRMENVHSTHPCHSLITSFHTRTSQTVLVQYSVIPSMDQVYQAKLTGSPPVQDHNPNPNTNPVNQQMDNNGDIHIQPMPNPHPHPQQGGPGVIPVQLPNIYVTAPSPASQLPSAPRREHRSHTHTTHQEPRMIHIGPFRFTRPHPLLWITLGLSLIALVLEVPKGSLPTLTGRHRQLRVRPSSHVYTPIVRYDVS